MRRTKGVGTVLIAVTLLLGCKARGGGTSQVKEGDQDTTEADSAPTAALATGWIMKAQTAITSLTDAGATLRNQAAQLIFTAPVDRGPDAPSADDQESAQSQPLLQALMSQLETVAKLADNLDLVLNDGATLGRGAQIQVPLDDGPGANGRTISGINTVKTHLKKAKGVLLQSLIPLAPRLMRGSLTTRGANFTTFNTSMDALSTELKAVGDALDGWLAISDVPAVPAHGMIPVDLSACPNRQSLDAAAGVATLEIDRAAHDDPKRCDFALTLSRVLTAVPSVASAIKARQTHLQMSDKFLVSDDLLTVQAPLDLSRRGSELLSTLLKLLQTPDQQVWIFPTNAGFTAVAARVNKQTWQETARSCTQLGSQWVMPTSPTLRAIVTQLTTAFVTSHLPPDPSGMRGCFHTGDRPPTETFDCTFSGFSNSRVRVDVGAPTGLTGACLLDSSKVAL